MRIVAILALGLVFMTGYRTDVAGTVSLTQARATCIAWDGTANAAGSFDSLVLIAEAVRDAGATEADYLASTIPGCLDPAQPDSAGCTSCITQLGAAIWN